MASTNPRYRNTKRRKEILRYWRRQCSENGVTCHICGQPIDPEAKWFVDPKDGKRKLHPYSLEVDELIPVSKGGDPCDIRNTAPAHRICNERRGNKLMHEMKATNRAMVTTQDWFRL